MRYFIKKLLREDLEYFSVTDATKDKYSIGLEEEIAPLNYKLPEKINISNQLKNKLSTISWSDISIDDVGSEYLNVKLPFGDFSNSIILRIQQTRNDLLQIHLDLSNELQNIGLGYKIYKAVINYLGYIYSAKSRRMNPKINSIWKSLNDDPDVECYNNSYGDSICFTKNKSLNYLEAKHNLLTKIGN